MPARTRLILAALVAALTVANSARAGLIILGNLPAANDHFTSTVDAGSQNGGNNSYRIRQAVSFTMPPQSYPVIRVNLRLSEYATTTGDQAAVGFYADSGNDSPGSLVGSLLSGPPSDSRDRIQLEFAPSQPLTLAASTKYWLMLDAITGFYQWQGSSPRITPTSQVGAVFGKKISLIDNEPRDSTLGIPSFQILTVPEPVFARLAILAFGAIVLLSARSPSNQLT